VYSLALHLGNGLSLQWVAGVKYGKYMEIWETVFVKVVNIPKTHIETWGK
jgi:hypothetical protein